MPEIETNRVVINDQFTAGESPVVNPEAHDPVPPMAQPSPAAQGFDRERADSQIRAMERSPQMTEYIIEHSSVGQQVRQLVLENHRKDAMLEFGIPRDKAVLIDGNTPEEIRIKAQTLAAILAQAAPTSTTIRPPEIVRPKTEIMAGTPEASAAEAEYAIRSNPDLARFLR